MSNCTISVNDSKALTKPKMSCRQAACNRCRRDMVSAPGHSDNNTSESPAGQHDIIHDFVQRLERSITKHSGN